MKRLALAVLLIAGLTIGMTGCDKASGQGWFYNRGCTACKVTFEFNIDPSSGCATGSCPIAAGGEFKLTDQNAKKNISGTFSSSPSFKETQPDTGSYFFGTCKVEGEGDYSLFIRWTDSGDAKLGKGDNLQVWAGPYQYAGLIEDGGIKPLTN